MAIYAKESVSLADVVNLLITLVVAQHLTKT